MKFKAPSREKMKWRCHTLGFFHSRGQIEDDVEAGNGEKNHFIKRYDETHRIVLTDFKDYLSEGEINALRLPVGTWGSVGMLAAKLATEQIFALMWAANKVDDDINLVSKSVLSASDAFEDEYEPRTGNEIVAGIEGLKEKLESIRDYAWMQPSIMYEYCALSERIRALSWFLDSETGSYGEFEYPLES